MTYAARALQSMRAHLLQNCPDPHMPFPTRDTLSDLALAAGEAMAGVIRSGQAPSEAERDEMLRALFAEVNSRPADATSDLAVQRPTSAELLRRALSRPE